MGKRSTNLIQVAWQAHQAGNLAQAERLYRQIIRKSPKNTEAHRLLANVLRRTNRVPEAVNHLKKALAFQPNNFDARTELARCHNDLGLIDEAVLEYHKAIKLKPQTPEAYLRPSSLLVRQNQFASAAEILQDGLSSLPDNTKLMRALADTSISIGRYDEAVKLYQALLKQQDSRDDPTLYFGLASAQRMAGNFDDALKSYDYALALQGDYNEALAGKAEILESRGMTDEAWSLIEPAMEHGGMENPDLVMTFARLAKQNNRIDDAIPFVRKALHQSTIEKSKKAMLYFTLGSLLEKIKQYDEAFSAYDSANHLFPTRFNEESYITGIDKLIEVFTGDSLSQLPRADKQSDASQPVYILGMMRSGTSLIEQMLSCHPAVGAGGELDCIPSRAGELTRQFSPDAPYPLALKKINSEKINELANSVRKEMCTINPQAKIITDKLPNNYIHLGFISLLFPDAKIIHCRRHPIDTCFSCFATQLGMAHSFANNLDHLAIAYKQYQRLMDHWKNTLSMNMLEVHYEKIIADPESEIRRILDFLELPWDASCLQFHKSGRITKTASMDQVRKPIYTTSRNRYKRFEKHLSSLCEALAEYC